MLIKSIKQDKSKIFKISSSFFRILNSEISLKKIFLFLLSRITGLKAKKHTVKLDDFYIQIRNEKALSQNQVVIKEFNPLYVLVRNKKIDYEVKINENSEYFKIQLPNIHYTPPIFTQIKWRYPETSLSTFFRDYFLGFYTKLTTLEEGVISIEKTMKINDIGPDQLELERRARITEEIIGIHPYVKKINRSKLYGLPISKKPKYKAYFSEEEMSQFRKALAKQGKTRISNVEISYIYDRLNVDIFESIKHDSETKNLICYPKYQHPVSDKSKLFYLIIGNRKDNKVSIKALATLDKE